ncbi:molybdopterin synthase catalytic subunit MoaE [Oceanibacterium hippocampi]|uniref:Molybdopterin synthase catalytic subunit n=1 Tax=Oceanibacterium hippocampi TaxID=745714 RepID=A0A1Y5U1G2_9PROT|nr:molybdopterin synthase catalytic subunit MoaE [Oceanibacterium hippocampi]SLN74466.1 Molybdopterin synthase catalytic subunit [Oceanibacterium hippocampi]
MIRVQRETFDIGREAAALTAGKPGIGALVTFTGLVRDDNLGRGVTALTLEHYPAMTERALARIEQEALSRWPLQASLVIHRFGRMLPGEPIVGVATAAAHRGDAFQAAEFLMDWLKTQAPFWKLETDGEAEQWVDARSSDEAAADRWRQPG